jgi:hypothetical protein
LGGGLERLETLLSLGSPGTSGVGVAGVSIFRGGGREGKSGVERTLLSSFVSVA